MTRCKCEGCEKCVVVGKWGAGCRQNVWTKDKKWSKPRVCKGCAKFRDNEPMMDDVEEQPTDSQSSRNVTYSSDPMYVTEGPLGAVPALTTTEETNARLLDFEQSILAIAEQLGNISERVRVIEHLLLIGRKWPPRF